MFTTFALTFAVVSIIAIVFAIAAIAVPLRYWSPRLPMPIKHARYVIWRGWDKIAIVNRVLVAVFMRAAGTATSRELCDNLSTSDGYYDLPEKLQPYYVRVVEWLYSLHGETIEAEYRKEISGWDWSAILAECASNPRESDDWGDSEELVGSCYLGQLVNPSGKYYLPFACSNVTQGEANKDECWQSALEAIASENGCWVESGEGDPTDTYICTTVESEDSED